MKKFIKKLRELPENKKKIILWAIVVILGIFLFSLFIKNTSKKLNDLQGKYFSPEMKMPELQQNLNSVPTQDMGQAIKQIQDILNQNKNQSQNENETQKENTK